MIERLSRASRRGQAGFTLIELLVVIIVLGILSAVVVFAVRGAGDRGSSAARSADEQTVRTAQESFCANTGRYGSIQELVQARMLSETPTYTGVWVDSPGPCGSTAYQTFSTDMPAIDGLDGTVCQPGKFCAGPLATGSGTCVNSSQQNNNANRNVNWAGLVQLPDGRLFATKSLSNNTDGCSTNRSVASFSIFDPTSGPMGSWSPLPPPDGSSIPVGAVPSLTTIAYQNAQAMLVIKGGPEWCGSNCGKVLAKFPTDDLFGDMVPWRLYDPNTSVPNTQSAGSWTALPTAPVGQFSPGVPYRRHFGVGVVQLTRTPCGRNCGKVLIVGGRAENNFGSISTPPDPEIWDPADGPNGSFRKLGLNTGFQETTTSAVHSATLLNDGRVLTIVNTVAQIFDPVTEMFTTVAPAPFRHSSADDSLSSLPDGSVLATFNRHAVDFNTSGPGRVGIFDPSGSGSWQDFPGCGDSTNKFCHVLTTLPGGKLLAKRTNLSPNLSTTLPLRVFDPATKTWSLTVAPTSPSNVVKAITLKESSPGSCAKLCNRVLTTGFAAAGMTGGWTSIYTP